MQPWGEERRKRPRLPSPPLSSNKPPSLSPQRDRPHPEEKSTEVLEWFLFPYCIDAGECYLSTGELSTAFETYLFLPVLVSRLFSSPSSSFFSPPFSFFFFFQSLSVMKGPQTSSLFLLSTSTSRGRRKMIRQLFLRHYKRWLLLSSPFHGIVHAMESLKIWKSLGRAQLVPTVDGRYLMSWIYQQFGIF